MSASTRSQRAKLYGYQNVGTDGLVVERYVLTVTCWAALVELSAGAVVVTGKAGERITALLEVSDAIAPPVPGVAVVGGASYWIRSSVHRPGHRARVLQIDAIEPDTLATLTLADA